MNETENNALDFLVHTISKHAQVNLSFDQRNAALEVLRSMPEGSTLSDFENACLGKKSMITGLSTNAIEILRPIALALEANNSYAGKFANLFECEQDTSSLEKDQF